MFDWVIGGLGDLFGYVTGAVGEVAGWAWSKVITGIYQWLANGLALLIEWVWSVLDAGTTPRVTADWFHNGVAGRVAAIGAVVTVAMMLLSACQAALAGRPEQILDLVRQGIMSIVASAFTVIAIDVLIGVTDEAAAMVWQVGRADLVAMLEQLVAIASLGGPLATTFVGPLCLLFGFVGLLGLVVSLLMRSALIYVVAAMAPMVWSLNVLPSFRGSSRRLVHLIVSLVLSKLAIVITLVVAVNLIANPTGASGGGPLVNQGAAAVGTLMSGFICFMIAAVTPMVLYRLMPVVEGAIASTGVAGGWLRGATTAAHTALLAKNLTASAATRTVSGQNMVGGQRPADSQPSSTAQAGAPRTSPNAGRTAVLPVTTPTTVASSSAVTPTTPEASARD